MMTARWIRRMMGAALTAALLSVNLCAWGTEVQTEAETQEQAQEEKGTGLGGLLGGLMDEIGKDEKLKDKIVSAKGLLSDALDEIGGMLEDPDSNLSMTLSGLADKIPGGAEALSGLADKFPGGAEGLSGTLEVISSLAENKDELVGTFGSVLSGMMNEDGSLDLEQIEMAVSLVAATLQGGETPDLISDDTMRTMIRQTLDSDEVYESGLDQAIKAYIVRLNEGHYEEGDATIVYYTTGAMTDNAILGNYWLEVYDLKEDGTLEFKAGGCDRGILTWEETGEDEFKITGSELLPDGDQREAAEVMCEKMGMDTEDFWNLSKDDPYSLYSAMNDYSKTNPKVTGFEFNGRVISIEEAREMLVDYTLDLFNQMKEAAQETEDVETQAE